MLFYKYLYYSELYIQILENSHLPPLISVPYILLILLFTYVLYYYYVVDYLLTKEKILYSIAFAFFIGLLIDLAVVLISKYIFYMN